MCGIVGAVAERNIVTILLEVLMRLEYRGYDSAGMAVLFDGDIHRVRSVGKVERLAQAIEQVGLKGAMGIAHTRWATHGKPTEANAHPHIAGPFAIVHNGIIENYAELKATLIKEGVRFDSETDTEVVAHLLHQAWQKNSNVLLALQSVVKMLRGAYALCVLVKGENHLYAVRSGAPLVVGLGMGENFVGSDCLALLPVTQRFLYLEEGDIAELSLSEVRLYDAQGQSVSRAVVELQNVQDAASKVGYKHYMQKEIHEQSVAVARTLAQGLSHEGKLIPTAFGPRAGALFKQIESIRIVACGTSYHAGMVAKYWLEEWAGVGTEVEVASELRYRSAVVRPHCLLLAISQSGETADTLAAVRQGRGEGVLADLAICNVPTSTLVRESTLSFLTQAGVELGVASTKAFTTQLVALMLLALNLAEAKGRNIQDKLAALQQLPVAIQSTLAIEPEVRKLAPSLKQASHALYLGRGVNYPLALEGALKLKEISYIHAEGYPAGELKHGPLALVDEKMPVIALAPHDALFEKLNSNLQEVQARGGKLFILTESQHLSDMHLKAAYLGVPTVPTVIQPFVYCIALQLLAYHVATLRGTDVDQPRNLAKSVTVE